MTVFGSLCILAFSYSSDAFIKLIVTSKKWISLCCIYSHLSKNIGLLYYAKEKEKQKINLEMEYLYLGKIRHLEI